MAVKTVALVSMIIIAAALAIGVGYAYTSSLEINSNNAPLSDELSVTPVSGDDSEYVGSAKVIRYSSSNDAGNMMYGIVSNASLTELKGIKLTFEGKAETHSVDSIALTIDTDMFVKDGYDSNQISAKLTKDGKEWTGSGPYVDQYAHSMKWVFGAMSDDGSTGLAASAASEEYGLSLVIQKDDDNTYPHPAKLSNQTFSIIIRANTSAPEHYYLYTDNNGHGDVRGAVADDSDHKFAPLADLSATGYIFGGWFADKELTVPFAFNVAVTEDKVAYAKWTPISYQVELILPACLSVKSGSTTQSVEYGTDMTPVVINAVDGYYFPYDYATDNDQGLTVTRDSAYQITVTGNITGQKSLTLKGASQFIISELARSVSEKSFEKFLDHQCSSSETSEENWWVYTGIDCAKNVNRVTIGGHLFAKSLKTIYWIGTDYSWNDLNAWKSIDGKLYISVPALYSLVDVNTGLVSVAVESSSETYLTIFDSALDMYDYGIDIIRHGDSPAKIAYTANERSAVLVTTDSLNQIVLTGQSEYFYRFDEGFNSFALARVDGAIYATYGNMGWNDDPSAGNSMFTRYSKVVSTTGNYLDVDLTFIYARTIADYNAVEFDSATSLTRATVEASFSINFVDGISQGLDLNGWDLYVGPDGSLTGTVNTYKSSSTNHIYYTVTFDSQGGSEVPPEFVPRKTYVPEPENPYKQSFEFGGWFLDQQCTEKYTFNERIVKSTVLYAKWTEAEAIP